MDLNCEFVQVAEFSKEQIPPSDLLIATFWTTVPAAIQAGQGIPVHFCQGYEAAGVENPALAERIRKIYALPGTEKITISPHLREIVASFGHEVREVTYAVDHAVMFPARERRAYEPLRIGLVGPYEIPWKDIRCGLEACRLASEAGLELELVRITNTSAHPDELSLPFPVDLHERVPPARMGELYRSLDVFLGTSRGAEEGFFMPAIEAMACGVPTVLTDIPCFRGYGSGEYAEFVAPQNPAAMAEAILRVGMDADLRGKLRRAGLELAAGYRMERHVDEFEAALEEIFAGTRGSAHDPLLASLHLQRAGELLVEGRFREAVASFERAINLDPSGAGQRQEFENLRKVLTGA